MMSTVSDSWCNTPRLDCVSDLLENLCAVQPGKNPESRYYYHYLDLLLLLVLFIY